ncbi:NAD(P)/FAD-dependent oxidoreductase [Nakamurella flava]|uniref:NAD(P)/FAD-dependent oxidoreductase n=1 Tax=Nakamurella flava TaxID=2576308 RepID=UPI00197B8077|nr:FAD-dependent oxidoreductase [Nakamurella flava]
MRIAVIGSGVAGLTSAYLLRRVGEVHLFEADGRLGGHAHTHEVPLRDGRVAGLDSGFLVHNDRTYPNLLRLFAELEVPTQDAEMSMSVCCDGCGLEYAGAKGLSGLFARPSSLARPRYLAMLLQVKRFHARARQLLDDESPTADAVTLDEFVRTNRFGTYFTTHFLYPLVAAVWSCGFDGARTYPARYLFRFLDNHGMLTVTGSPQWRTVTGGSRTYVERVAKQLSSVATATPIRAVTRHADGVELRDETDEVHRFDRVVLATHPDQALAMLADATADEQRLLSRFGYVPSTAFLHTDGSLLPSAPRARSSWNYRMASCASDDQRVHISYDLNRLQRVDDRDDHVVTLNPDHEIDPARVLARMEYAHPTYTPDSVAAQREIGVLNTDRTAFAGAWQGWGFHEDGCASGVRAAAAFGAGWNVG